MSTTQDATPTPDAEAEGTFRVEADGETATKTTEPTPEPLVAKIPGSDPKNFVAVHLAHPLRKSDREYLGLDVDSPSEVGQVVHVNRNGARILIDAGLAQVDVDNPEAVAALLGKTVGEQAQADTQPREAAGSAEAPATPLDNPPEGASTPGGDAPVTSEPATDDADQSGRANDKRSLRRP